MKLSQISKDYAFLASLPADGIFPADFLNDSEKRFVAVISKDEYSLIQLEKVYTELQKSPKTTYKPAARKMVQFVKSVRQIVKHEDALIDLRAIRAARLADHYLADIVYHIFALWAIGQRDGSDLLGLID